MFARTVTMKLKPNSVPEFTRKLESEIIPLLQKQTGFRDELTFVTAGEREVHATSLWARREDAEAYNAAKYAEVIRMLGGVVDGTPQVQTGEVSHSTFHSIPAYVPAK